MKKSGTPARRRIRPLSARELQSAGPLPRELVDFFLRSGVVRRPRPELLKAGSEAYKHGWEVRLVLRSASELRRVRSLLARAGFRVANAYAKAIYWVQPVYGQLAVYRFELEAFRAGQPGAASPRRGTQRRRSPKRGSTGSPARGKGAARREP